MVKETERVVATLESQAQAATSSRAVMESGHPGPDSDSTDAADSELASALPAGPRPLSVCAVRWRRCDGGAAMAGSGKKISRRSWIASLASMLLHGGARAAALCGVVRYKRLLASL